MSTVFKIRQFIFFKCFITLSILSCFTTIYSQDDVLRFEHITVDDGLPQNTIQGIAKDKYGFMWFGTWEGLCKFDGYDFTIYRADKENPKTIYNNRIHFIYKDKEGNIWISGADTLVSRYNYETDDFTRYKNENLPAWLLDSLDRFKSTSFTSVKTSNYTWRVFQLHNILTRKIQVNDINNLLTQTNNKTGSVQIYRTEPINPWALLDEYVFQLYIDDQEIFWVGTYSGGIQKADLRQKPFTYYFKKYNDPNTLADNLIRALCEDNQGNLWVGTHNKGVTRIDRAKNIYTQFTFQKNDPLHSLSDNLIRKIYCDHNGEIWIGTKNGLDRYNSKTNTFKHYTFPLVKGKPANWVYSITEDHYNNLWIGTWTGIGKYDPQTDKFHIFNPENMLPSHFIRVVEEDEDYNLWVATEKGLAKLNRNSSEGYSTTFNSTIYRSIPGNNNSLSDDRIYTMLCDSDGIIWLGTAKGLNKFDSKINKFTHFGFDEGIPDEFIVGIIKDNNGNLWISHKKGISKFNIKTHSVRNYTKFDGLQSNDFSEDAYYKSPTTGELFFGGPQGFNSFFPEKIKDNPHPALVRFTQLKINNKVVGVGDIVNNRIILKKPLYLLNEISLSANDKIFSIEFAALHYASPKKNNYAYILEGFNKEWVYTDASDRNAVYSNLPPGKYVFKVKASNCDGLWNKTPTQISIIVKPPFWKTWWFILLSILFILLFLFGINQWRISRYINIQTNLTDQVEQRTRLLKESNDLLNEKQQFIQKQTEELIETNKQLSVLNTTKDKLFSIVAHDLRNPFNVVGGFSELLINKIDSLPKEKVLKYLNLIHVSSKNANILLENLLDWSRMQTGRISFEPETIHIDSIAKESIEITTGDLQRKNIQIDNQIDTDVYVFADPNMIKTVFRNLISNAIKFSDENSVIALKTNIIDHKVEVSVCDNGTGMTPEIMNMLFRIDTSISYKGTSNESGTGLGLIICKEFIDKHNGTIRVKSEPDKGSTFTFTLPLG